MNWTNLHGAQLREALAAIAVEIAVKHYKRRHPQASDAEAQKWAVANCQQFKEQALNMMVALRCWEEDGRLPCHPPVPVTPERPQRFPAASG